MTDWNVIAEEYITGDVAMRPLAARYGVPFQTLGGRAARGGWTRRREEYRRMNEGEDGLPRRCAPRNDAGEEGEGAEESAMMSEAVSLSLGWILRRLRSGEIDDWHEIDGLLRALKGARDVGTTRLRLDERETRLKIAALEKGADKNPAPEPIEVRFVSLEGAER